MDCGASATDARAERGGAVAARSAAAVGAAAIAAAVVFGDRRHGAYFGTTWGPLGVAEAVAAFALACTGRRTSRTAVLAVALLAALGALSLASIAWGGLPKEAWRGLDLALLGGLALLVGALGFARRPRLAAAALLAAITAQAAEVLARSALDAPDSWLVGRVLDGPFGYHNAQGVLFAIGAALALGELDARAAPVRAVAAASATACLGALLLTQSRGSLAALCVAGVLHVAVRSDAARILRTCALAGAGVVLALRLGRVDASLLERSPDLQASLRAYAAAVALAAAAAAALAALPLPSRRVPGAATAAVLVAAAAFALVPTGRLDTAWRQLATDVAPAAGPGGTRFASLSLNGRRDAWRVAARMTRAHPLLGAGAGSFARAWTRERRLAGLYIRQPHSIVLETTAELGALGLVLWLGFLAATVAAVARARSPARRAALLALACLAVEASVDWTWSFPGVLVPVLLVAGAATGVGARRRLPVAGLAALVPATLAAAALLALPWLAARELHAAAADRDPARAWRLAARARMLAPGDPDPVAFEARLAEAEGRYLVAAALYAAAARRSQEPWALEWARARALRGAARPAAAALACREALVQNPGEPRLRTGPCAEASRAAGVRTRGAEVAS